MLVVALANVGVALVCALIGLASAGLPIVSDAWQAVLAPASGVAAAAVLAGGLRLLPGSMIGLALAVSWLRPDAPWLALGVTVCVAFAAAWASVYARYAVDDRPADLLFSLRGVLAFVGLAAGSFAVWTAALGALAEIILAGGSRAHEAFEGSLLRWSISHFVAVAVIAPPVIAATAGGLRIAAWRGAGRLLLWGAMAALAAVTFTAGPGHAGVGPALPFLVLPVLLTVAALSAAKTSAALTAVAAVAWVATVSGTSVWGEVTGVLDLMPLAMVLTAFAVCALPFAALMRERREAVAALAATNADLEQRIAARTAEAVAGEARLRHMLDGSPVAACVVEPGGRLIFTNTAFRTLFGLAAGEAAEFDVCALYEDPSDRAAQMERLTRDGLALDMEYRYRRRDGTPVWVLEHSVMAEFDGAPAIVAWMVDITARHAALQELAAAKAELAVHRDQLAQEVADRTADLQRARDAAEAANRAKTEFLANMSHELRTPLNAIIGFAQMIENDLLGPGATGAYRDYATNIHRSGGHLLAVIDDILDMARFEAGRLTVADDRVELTACIERALTLTAPPPGSDAPQVSLDLPRRAPALRGDRRRIEQMLVKLLSNAVRFTGSGANGGHITISLSREPSGHLLLAIADTGIGMTAQDIDRALRPFVQVDTGLGRRYEGTGLGLPLARAFAELHGGSLAIASTPGAGTTVSVRFPPDRVLEPYAVASPQAQPQAESA
ncbi:ATP-binding protein [Caenispirillum bisanense]|uniref:ATP-binding protein n=1 Tax=Caenispirillum bisanense TaxID=414052 RepID=UPI0031CF1B15